MPSSKGNFPPTRGRGGREAKKGGMGGREDPERGGGGGGSILFLPSIPSPHFSDDCKEEGARNGVRSPAARLNIESRWIARPTLPHPSLPSEREREEKKAAASAMFYPISPERSEAASTLYSSTTQLPFFLRRVFVCCCSLPFSPPSSTFSSLASRSKVLQHCNYT